MQYSDILQYILNSKMRFLPPLLPFNMGEGGEAPPLGIEYKVAAVV